MRRLAVALTFVTLLAAPAHAQDGSVDIPPPAKLVQVRANPVTLAAGAGSTATVTLEITSGWHINANPPSPDYMVPTVVELIGRDGVVLATPVYPAARTIKLGFEESEISVFDGRVSIALPLVASLEAMNGAHTLSGKIRFQACNNQLCLAPASVPFSLTVTVTGGIQSGAATPPAPPGNDVATTSDSAAVETLAATPAPSDRFTTTPPTNTMSSVPVENPLAKAIAGGGIGAILALLLIGLSLNLTPCVYPMLGVTVSIFGARKAAPPLQVFGLALVYVLGMASMYSVLGMAAALTGGLFGGFMQNPIVLIGIGLLLAAMAFSMFGFYEIQMPAALRERASTVKAVGVAGVFMSGLVVGVFAAPCIGAPIVALMAIVGARGDPWFGFTTFFTLAFGLGLPYLVLGTFSNLLQNLPRSGDWMEWVKKVFGVVMLAIAGFYILLGIAPDLAHWVVPVALVGGGGYLGFINRNADRRVGFRWFKRVGGVAAVIGGLAIVASTPRHALAMAAFTPAGLEAASRSGRVAIIDFSAEWCVPCHELDRFTFTDRRVIDAARAFATFKADLTRYDTPESESLRKQYQITGVPTVVFITPDGREVRESRVEGFLAPEKFLERMAHAAQSVARVER